MNRSELINSRISNWGSVVEIEARRAESRDGVLGEGQPAPSPPAMGSEGAYFKH